MPDWIGSALIGTVIAFILNAGFQVRRDIKAVSDRLNLAVEQLRSAMGSRSSILLSVALNGKLHRFDSYMNSLRQETVIAENTVNVLINSEFPHLKPQWEALNKAIQKQKPLIIEANRDGSCSKYEVDNIMQNIHRECNLIQKKLIAARSPCWLTVIKQLVVGR